LLWRRRRRRKKKSKRFRKEKKACITSKSSFRSESLRRY
jgi:hypothetical protein